jgi:histidinol-phosphate aminotransferase
MRALARIRPELAALAGYSSARMEAGGGRVFLNANESPWPQRGDALNRYPEPQPAVLRARLAQLYGVPEDAVLVGRGSDEAIDLLTRAFCRAGVDEVIVAPPTFGMYEVCARIQGARVRTLPLGAGFAYPFDAVAAGEETKLVYVCSPNNPTGNTVAPESILALAKRLEGVALVVVDEAYIEFAEVESLAAHAAGGANLAVLRTLSKAHALAGARVGCVVADPALIGLLRRLMAPYPLPTPSVRAAEEALSNSSLQRTRENVARIVAERARVAARLAALPGVREVFPSAANFVCARLAEAQRAYAGLLAQGVVVRDVGRYPGLADCLRFTIGSDAENDALLAALAALMSEAPA